VICVALAMQRDGRRSGMTRALTLACARVSMCNAMRSDRRKA